MDDELTEIRRKRLEEIQAQTTVAQANAGPVEVTTESLPAFVKANDVVMIDVWASWCGPCRMMEPIVDELAAEWTGKAGIGKLNSDENYDTVMRYGIQGIPTFLFFKAGELAGRMVGARPKRDFQDVLRQLSAASVERDQAFQ